MFWLIIFSFFVRPVFAQTAAVTPTPTPNTSEEVQKFKEALTQKVAEKLRQITNPTSAKKAFLAKIIQIGTDSLSVDYQNNPRTLAISSDTVYVDAKGNKIKLANIKVGQDILVLGTNDAANSTFAAKRIILVDPTTILYKKTVVIGKIVDVSRTSPIFSLIPIRNKNDLFQIKTSVKTEVLDSKYQKIKSTNLKSGQKIIAVLQPDIKISKTYSALSLINLDYTPEPSPTPVKK